MNKKAVLWVLSFFTAAFTPGVGFAQTKIMEYKTGIEWSDEKVFLTSAAVPVGTDYLAIPVNHTGSSDPDYQNLYILDVKKKTLALKLDAPDRGFYQVWPSATTSSFVLYYCDQALGQFVSLYIFNKRTKTWTQAITDTVDTGFATVDSAPVLPGYFVNTVQGSDNTLELHIFRY